jgi:probable HAF family extracellular repeat protein
MGHAIVTQPMGALARYRVSALGSSGFFQPSSEPSEALAPLLPTEPGTLGGNQSIPVDVNDYGQVVGTSKTEDGGYHPFLWSAEDGMVDIGTLGGEND